MLVLEPALAGIIVNEADGAQPQLRVAHQLTNDEPAAVAAADDQHVAGALGGTEATHAALAHQVHAEAHCDQEHERERQERGDHAGRQLHGRCRPGTSSIGAGCDVHPHALKDAVELCVADGMQQRDHDRDQHGGDDQRLDDGHVVTLADVAPQALVGAEPGKHDHGSERDPDRPSSFSSDSYSAPSPWKLPSNRSQKARK